MKILSISIILFALVLLELTGCSQEKEASAPPPPPEVEVAKVVQKDVPVYNEWAASIDGIVNATILARVQGYLVKQNYKEGDFVKEGTLLFEIDARPFQTTLDEARAELSTHQAILHTAQQNLKRILPLAAVNAVSQRDKDNSIGLVQAGEAQVLEAKARVRRAELELSFTKILSPIDGIAGAANAQIGDLVGTPQVQFLTKVSTVNPIRVNVHISEQEYMDAVERSNGKKPDSEKLSLTLLLTDGSTWPYKGEFSFADRQVDTQTGTIRIAILFANPENVLRPGQFAKVRALMNTEKGALLVPQRAVGELQGSHQVAVLDAANTVHIRGIKVGQQYQGFWVIREGLAPGEQVIAEGTQKVGNGVKIKPKPISEKEE